MFPEATVVSSWFVKSSQLHHHLKTSLRIYRYGCILQVPTKENQTEASEINPSSSCWLALPATEAEALSSSWPASGFESQEIYDWTMIHWHCRSQTDSFFVLRFQLRTLASLPSNKGKRAAINIRSKIKTPSCNHPFIIIKTKQRLIKNSSIWTKNLEKTIGRKHRSKGECFQTGYRAYFNEPSMIFRKFNRKLF